MTKGLVRYQLCGCFHFVMFSCYRRLLYLGTESARNHFERSLEAMWHFEKHRSGNFGGGFVSVYGRLIDTYLESRLLCKSCVHAFQHGLTAGRLQIADRAFQIRMAQPSLHSARVPHLLRIYRGGWETANLNRPFPTLAQTALRGGLLASVAVPSQNSIRVR